MPKGAVGEGLCLPCALVQSGKTNSAGLPGLEIINCPFQRDLCVCVWPSLGPARDALAEGGLGEGKHPPACFSVLGNQ